VPLDAVAPTEILGHDGLLSLVKPGFVGAALAVSAKDRKRLFAPRFRFRRSVAGKPKAGLEQTVNAGWGSFPDPSSPRHGTGSAPKATASKTRTRFAVIDRLE
jgi:hypothetical protein